MEIVLDPAKENGYICRAKTRNGRCFCKKEQSSPDLRFIFCENI